MPNKPVIIPKFSTFLLFGLICQCKKFKAGEGSVPRAILREAPVCKKLTPKLVPIRPKILPQHVGAMSLTPCQVS